MMSDRLPPFAEDVERAALGCILLAPENAGKMLSKLTLADLYDRRHRTIFGAMARLHASGKKLDVITLLQELKEKAEIQNAGDNGYVMSLPEAVPSEVNFDYYLPTLKDKAARRALLKLAGRAAELAYDESLDSQKLSHEFTWLAASIAERGSEPKEWFRFYSPSECREYNPPEGVALVGDCHIVRGAVTVIAGPPGVGKSRVGHALAVAGGLGSDWFGLKVHRRFKTAILQNENGRLRLKQEFTEIGADFLDEFVRISGPPPFGMTFERAEFRSALANWFEEWKPELVIFDPWNSAVRDDGQRDYRALFDALKEVLPKGEAEPALVIIAHTRKPKADERKTGRGLLNDVAGSHVLISVPRCVFIMQSASHDPDDDRVVWTCAKNNDGAMGKRSAWHRRNGLFVPCSVFDWEAFDNPANGSSGMITKEHLHKLFDGGKRKLSRKAAVAELEEATGFKKTACYAALDLNGRFKDHLYEDGDGLFSWTP